MFIYLSLIYFVFYIGEPDNRKLHTKIVNFSGVANLLNLK